MPITKRRPISKRVKVISIVALSFAFLTYIGFVVVKTLIPRNELHDIAQLEKVVPIIEQYKVKSFQDASWCKSIDYARGRFSNSRDGSCAQFGGNRLFDEQAQRDYDSISRALSDSGTDVHFVSADLDETGNFRSIQFHLPSTQLIGWTRRSYEFRPDTSFPYGVENEIVYRRINDHWYFREEDWN